MFGFFFISKQKSVWKCSIYEELAFLCMDTVPCGRARINMQGLADNKPPISMSQRILGVPSGGGVDPSLVAVHSPAMSTSFVMTLFSSSSSTGVALFNLI